MKANYAPKPHHASLGSRHLRANRRQRPQAARPTIRSSSLAGRHVSDRPGKNYAPTRLESDPENGNVGREAFGKAMERLFTLRSIKLEQHGSPSRRTNIIVRF